MGKISGTAAVVWIAIVVPVLVLAVIIIFGDLHFNVSTQPVQAPVVDAPRSPATAQCPVGWRATTGTDPDSRYNFVTCTDGTIIITIRENQQPTGFNTKTGQFLSAGEVSTILNAPR